jgi:hypothetical protein
MRSSPTTTRLGGGAPLSERQGAERISPFSFQLTLGLSPAALLSAWFVLVIRIGLPRSAGFEMIRTRDVE